MLAAAKTGNTFGIDPETVDPLSQLRWMLTAQYIVDQATEMIVRKARENGCTWAQIGSELEMSRQAAQQRFGS